MLQTSIWSGSSSSSIRSVEAVGVAFRQPSKSRIRRHTNRLSGLFLRGPIPSSSPMALSTGFRSSLSSHSRKGSMLDVISSCYCHRGGRGTGSNIPFATRRKLVYGKCGLNFEKDKMLHVAPGLNLNFLVYLSCLRLVTPAVTPIADDPAELSNQITAPGILKIFGSEICEGAHYKSVLATTHSSAQELVKEALERYGLGKEEAGSYVLCDAIGSIMEHQWKTEGFRVVGDNEKPLLLQSLWKPREGLARRFEIQRRALVEEKRAREKDTVTAGINAQARKLQKSRSRVTSTLIERTVGRSQLWRSKSEMDLLESDTETQRGACQNSSFKTQNQNQNLNSARQHESTSKHNQKASPKQNHIQSEVHNLAAPSQGDARSRAKTETLCPARQRAERDREESEREETESSDDNTTQYSIHPPQDCPYLLLLQGCSLTQDFVIYLLTGPSIVIGRRGDNGEGSKTDILLYASDILPKHCCFSRHNDTRSTILRPSQSAMVTRNGEVLRKEVELSPGDVIGLGQRYLFLFKDPSAVTHKEVNDTTPEPHLSAAPWLLSCATSATREPILCNTCISTYTDLQSPNSKHSLKRGTPFLKAPEGHSLTVNYERELEDRIVKEIIVTGTSNSKDIPAMTAAFLLCVCVQYSAVHFNISDLRRLLLLIASGVQSTMWEHTKKLAAVQPEVLVGDGSDLRELQPLSLEELISGLRPLVMWMSNSLELLYFIQHQLPLILDWRTRKEQGQDDEEREDEENSEEEKLALLELRLSCIRSASEETVAVLEEVIMLTFQQCVYYITKVLYPILPGLLDCNPFRDNAEQHTPGLAARVLGSGRLRVPGEARRVLEVLTETRQLLQDCQLHLEISSQLLAYLFYFINASLFNTLMERGSEAGFYHWSRGVCIRANLDLLLDWALGAGPGLGQMALEYTHTLSSAVNLLATPRENLLQTSWASLRSDYPALSPAQLNHLLSLYSPASPCPHTWAPSAQEQAAAHRTAEILESFDTHHPLVLPGGGYQLQLRRAVTDSALRKQLDRLKEFISTLSDSNSIGDTTNGKPQGCAIPTEAKLIKMDILPKASLESLHLSPVEVILPQLSVQSPSPTSPISSPPSPTSTPPSAHCLDEFSSCGALLLSQKLRNLELQTAGSKRSALDPSCLLTPPNTPYSLELVDVEKENQDKWMKAGSETHPWSSGVNVHEEGGLVSECLAALTADGLKSECTNMRKIVELKEEEEEAEEVEEDDDDNNDEEIFSLQLERGEQGLGLALVDTRDTPLKMNGIFVRAVVPNSPAALCEKLLPGDRILAVNGISLLDLDYQRGKELIQASGDRPRFLVARSDWMAKALQDKC
ncbi:ras-associating and dilute domain-containing protein isoform X2 [Myripristis murdjan]|uniref:ras-associating and dilute domain-containing protein isoform X2 n=1 Tax=Myripristis murdjan TaxID=586833 RepID=UPI001175F439|nr:ras-associating and dilute domain-containing protein-like isoform X2 [Myripristis murdjan]